MELQEWALSVVFSRCGDASSAKSGSSVATVFMESMEDTEVSSLPGIFIDNFFLSLSSSKSCGAAGGFKGVVGGVGGADVMICVIALWSAWTFS